MDTAVLLLGAILVSVGVVWTTGVLIVDRLASRYAFAKREPSVMLGTPDRIAIYPPRRPFIPMPKHLRTRDGMVGWMTRDPPRLILQGQKPGAI